MFNKVLCAFVAVAFCLFSNGCTKKDETGEKSKASTAEKSVIQNAGSDTMVNLAQAWAEEYATVKSNVSIEVSGGGSGTGIAALTSGTVDIANCSRQITSKEIERIKQNTGEAPKEFIVGYDGLAVYVHEDNPLAEISIEQLASIYGEGGDITEWSQLGIDNSECANDEIIRVSRQSNSGTFVYFRAAILGKNRDYKLGSRDLHGSKDVVELIAHTPCAIGYSGMGYATEEVKMLKIAKTAGNTAYGPTAQGVLDGTYPIARPLYMYSLGTPEPQEQSYLDWIFSPTGQGIVAKTGYVPIGQK
jgi:phosphate transport system substrate-binding protein